MSWPSSLTRDVLHARVGLPHRPLPWRTTPLFLSCVRQLWRIEIGCGSYHSLQHPRLCPRSSPYLHGQQLPQHLPRLRQVPFKMQLCHHPPCSTCARRPPLCVACPSSSRSCEGSEMEAIAITYTLFSPCKNTTTRDAKPTWSPTDTDQSQNTQRTPSHSYSFAMHTTITRTLEPQSSLPLSTRGLLSLSPWVRRMLAMSLRTTMLCLRRSPRATHNRA